MGDGRELVRRRVEDFPGFLIMSQTFDGSTFRIAIDRADPRVTVSAELLYEIGANTEARERWGTEVDGDLLRIGDDDGRRFVYRLVDYVPERSVWLAEWVD